MDEQVSLGEKKCHKMKVQRYIGIRKEALQKQSKLLRDRKISLKTMKRKLNCYFMSNLLYGSEFCTISSQMKRFEVTREVILPANAENAMDVSNKEILGKIGITKKIYTYNQKKTVKLGGESI